MTDTIFRLLAEYHVGDSGVKVETPSTDTIVVSEGRNTYTINVDHHRQSSASQTPLGSVGAWFRGVRMPHISSAEEKMWRQNQTIAVNMYRARHADKYTVARAFELFQYVFDAR